jgi:hypothetical protein
MNLKKYKPILETGIFSILVYVGHKLFFYFNSNNPKFQNFYFPIEWVCSFFSVCSLLIIFALVKIKEKNTDTVGFAFLWLTSVKIGLSYAFLQLIVNAENQNTGIEKSTFLII